MFNFVVWNTGQGSWATFINTSHCFHFDMGGESVEVKKILRLCQNKKNQVYLTHLDWDHINKIQSYSRKVSSLCLYYPKAAKKSFIKKKAKCLSKPAFIKIISLGQKNNQSNDGSIVYLLKEQVLITGDAPMKEEKKWLHKIPKKIRILILGHHGSKTSTSTQLLNRTQPQQAIASARKSKYGHPHPKVVRKLKQRQIPLLETEKLGNIFYQLK